MYRSMWQQYPDKKWYVRAMDDTLLHLANLVHHLSHYDPAKVQ